MAHGKMRPWNRASDPADESAAVLEGAAPVSGDREWREVRGSADHPREAVSGVELRFALLEDGQGGLWLAERIK